MDWHDHRMHKDDRQPLFDICTWNKYDDVLGSGRSLTTTGKAWVTTCYIQNLKRKNKKYCINDFNVKKNVLYHEC
jgi:hypothetical protein